jgi:hypothetical protein
MRVALRSLRLEIQLLENPSLENIARREDHPCLERPHPRPLSPNGRGEKNRATPVIALKRPPSGTMLFMFSRIPSQTHPLVLEHTPCAFNTCLWSLSRGLPYRNTVLDGLFYTCKNIVLDGVLANQPQELEHET